MRCFLSLGEVLLSFSDVLLSVCDVLLTLCGVFLSSCFVLLSFCKNCNNTVSKGLLQLRFISFEFKCKKHK